MLALIYVIVAYWAVGQTVYRNKIVIGTMANVICQKLLWAILLGWLLIPIAIIRLLIELFGKK